LKAIACDKRIMAFQGGRPCRIKIPGEGGRVVSPSKQPISFLVFLFICEDEGGQMLQELK